MKKLSKKKLSKIIQTLGELLIYVFFVIIGFQVSLSLGMVLGLLWLRLNYQEKLNSIQRDINHEVSKSHKFLLDRQISQKHYIKMLHEIIKHDKESAVHDLITEWTIDDVMGHCDYVLDRKQGAEILDMVAKNHDPSEGINWKVIDRWTEVWFEQNPEVKRTPNEDKVD
jgi:hypothetical protein